MKFEIGKFYLHEAGRAIAILGEIETYKAGKQLFVEETDPTGHGFSMINIGSVCIDGSWTEIGKDGWDKRFKETCCCAHCGLSLTGGQRVMKLDDGRMYHVACLNKAVEEEKP